MADSSKASWWRSAFVNIPKNDGVQLVSKNNPPLDYQALQIDRPETIPRSHQLVVLGNGFDLQCGLKSRFSDFYKKEKRKKIKNLLSCHDVYGAVQNDSGSNNRLTIWDLILSRPADSDWCDIEKVIEEWVTDETVVSDDDSINVNQYIEHMCEQSTTPDLVNGEFDFDPDKLCNAIKEHTLATLSTTPTTTSSKEVFFGYLMRELNVLEQQFSWYLEAELERVDYKAMSGKCLLEILKDSVDLGEENRVIDYSILDFNYTTPTLYECAPFGDTEIVNIHGQLGSKIIFGIDGADYLNNPLIAPFTKTRRLLSMWPQPLDGLVVVPDGGAFDEGTIVVKFYGHSLGDADYSYFQSIFNELNISSGLTRLIFYYNPDREERSRKEEAVVNLINKYDSGLGNSEHTENLMNRLILQGKLAVMPLQLPVL